MKKAIRKCLFFITEFFLKNNIYLRELRIRQRFNLDNSVKFFNLSIEGNVEVGKNTYFNDGCRIDTGSSSYLKIGRHCAIGRWVHITAKTHDLRQPTTTEQSGSIPHLEKDTVIGNYVWIGDHCVINAGVTVGDHAVIGANSFVNKDVKPFEIVGGVPAKHIRFNEKNPFFNE
ncbi:acyltransferase [Ekhidna sp.]|jgi:acetyltransferase-like isoleucine patch superfamily enzyme|uniref:acyltransferase n=1 Tax=Ekhidna sp. TaxID=2608089 RepID=UPI0032EE5518